MIVASDACAAGGGGREGCVWVEVGRGAKKKEKSWLAKQREISFAQQIRTAARYKLSGCSPVSAL